MGANQRDRNAGEQSRCHRGGLQGAWPDYESCFRCACEEWEGDCICAVRSMSARSVVENAGRCRPIQ